MSKELNGIIVINKPKGFTSFDVIAKLRGILHIKRLGHAGTLDPMATGVLPVFVGKATKACDILPNNEKSYKAGFKLGIKTDTQDITGNIIFEEKSDISFDSLAEKVKIFLGETEQLPPMYSAVSVGGKRLYELAREGKEAERKPRKIYVKNIEIVEFDEVSQTGVLDIHCSKGTYIRTIIHDLGEALGTGGVLTSLERMYSSGYDLSKSHSLEEIQSLAESGTDITEIMFPIDSAFEQYEKVILNYKHTRLYKNGVRLRLEQVGIRCENTYRVYGSDNEFLGLAFADKKANEFIIKKNFF